uniref:Coiled-coil domain-containing protein 172 n=1 Tax=Pavo cristatus TaxID=9049 RepID=A0A8C9G022_PAVCR
LHYPPPFDALPLYSLQNHLYYFSNLLTFTSLISLPFFFSVSARTNLCNTTREVTEFNDEYGLTSNRELLIKKKVKTEINNLENEAAVLKNEMESMEHKNVHLNALQLQKNELKQELFTLESELKDLEKLIKEAEGTMKDLEAEKAQVTEKPQTNPECLSEYCFLGSDLT